MPSFRRTRRFNRKRSYARRKLSKTNIYLNRGARSQATQIAALNRKINAISRRDRPETQIINGSPVTIQFPDTGNVPNYYSFVMASPEHNSSDLGTVNSDCFKLYDTSLRIYMKLASTPASNIGGSIRIFALQVISTSDISNGLPVPPGLNDVIFGASTNFTDDDYLKPFTNNITNQYRVLFNRVYSVSQDKPVFSKLLTMRPKHKLCRFGTNNQSNPTGSSGWILWYVCCSNMTISGTYVLKTAYAVNRG